MVSVHSASPGARAAAAADQPREFVEVDDDGIRSNIVICRLQRLSAATFCERLAARDVLAIPIGEDRARFVTHRDVDRDGIETAIGAAAEAVAG